LLCLSPLGIFHHFILHQRLRLRHTPNHALFALGARNIAKKRQSGRENGESQLSEQLWLICIKQRGSRNYWRAGRAIGMHTGGWLAGWRLVIKASLKHAPPELIHLFISSHWHSGHATLRPDKSY
jgi:hypothetical protein